MHPCMVTMLHRTALILLHTSLVTLILRNSFLQFQSL